MKITIDPDMCQGNGLCLAKAPQVFALGDDERAFVVQAEPGDDLADAVRAAVNACPTQAISIDDG